MKIHINYAHAKYTAAQRLNTETALSCGGFDVSIPHGLANLDPEFIKQNQNILFQPRGAGYWLWKPYLILKYLRQMDKNDWLMYTDSGLYFCDNPWPTILSEEDAIGSKGIMTFGEVYTNGMYTKRDCFVLMGMDSDEIRNKPQRIASSFVCKRTDFSISFVEEWLRLAQDPRIVTDLPNTQRLSNYPEFKDHRHDQSIMSLLTIKNDTCVYTKKGMVHFQNNVDPCLIGTGESDPVSIQNARDKYVGDCKIIMGYVREDILRNKEQA